MLQHMAQRFASGGKNGRQDSVRQARRRYGRRRPRSRVGEERCWRAIEFADDGGRATAPAVPSRTESTPLVDTRGRYVPSIYAVLVRPHRMPQQHRRGLLLRTSLRPVVCLSVGHDREPCRSG